MPQQGKMTQQAQTTSQMELPPWLQAAWQGVYQQAQNAPHQLADYDPGFKAPTNQSWTQANYGAQNMQPVDYSTVNAQLSDAGAFAQGQRRDPNAFQYTNTYNPTAYQPTSFNAAQVNFNDPMAGYRPNAQGATMQAAAYSPQNYDFKVDQVSSQQIGAAPQVSAERVGGLANNIRSFDIGPQGQIVAPQLQQYQMAAPQQVTARDVTTNAFIDPGVRQQYMDPYMQAVVDAQQADAQRTFNEQLAQSGGTAAAAGAFGGTRQAVLESAMRRDLANQKGQIAATGLENAYQNAQQQFERDRAANVQAQQLNQQAGLQAGTANQSAGLQANQANLQALLSQQELGANQSMQAQTTNQNVNLQTALANQQAQLQAQGLGVNTNLQSMLANQQYGLQAQLANQNAYTDVAKANQNAALQAAMANQQYNLMGQTQGAQLSQADRQFGAGLTQQANQMNAQNQQAANMLNANLGFNALQQSGQWGMQAGLANQQTAMQAQQMAEQSRQYGATLGEQQNQFGANMNLQTQQAQQDLINRIIQQNLAANQQGADLYQQIGANDATRFNQGLAANQQLGNFGLAQAGMDQQAQQNAYNHWLMQQNYPMQNAMQMAGLMSPMSNVFGTQRQTQYGLAPSMFSQVMGGLMAGAGMLM